jgi:uncharacterized membrane protein YphA (DoxX/SURF4 family)
MTNPLKTPAAVDFGLLLTRVALGSTFLLFGCEKLFRIGVKKFVDLYTSAIPTAWLPKPIGQTYLYAVPYAEFIVGSFLIAGFCTRTIGFIATLMLISFSIAITGLFTNGDIFHLNQNMAYIAMAILLMVMGPGTLSADRAISGPEMLGR